MARPKGSTNKATTQMRMVVAKFLDDNSHRLQGWLDQIEMDNGPLEAFKRIEALLEYTTPKLARTELTGEDGKELTINLTKTVHSARDID